MADMHGCASDSNSASDKTLSSFGFLAGIRNSKLYDGRTKNPPPSHGDTEERQRRIIARSQEKFDLANGQGAMAKGLLTTDCCFFFFHLRGEPAQKAGADIGGQVSKLNAVLAFAVRPCNPSGKFGFLISLRNGERD